MKVTLKFSVDWLEAVQDVVTDLLSQQDAVDGVGADGDSEYEVIDVDASVEEDGNGTVTFELQRVTGKFASRADVTEALLEELADADITVSGVLTVERGD